MASLRSTVYKTLLRHTVRGQAVTYERILRTRARGNSGFLGRLLGHPEHLNYVSYPCASGAAARGVWAGSSDAQHIIYYLHGGGYMIGSPQTHFSLVSALCARADMKAFIPDYRLAPENPFPAGLDDSLDGYRWLLDQGYSANRIHFAGDSAGGGLALATCLRARDEGIPLPRSLSLLSPWTDLTASGASYRERATRDPMLDARRVPEAVALYVGELDPKHPYISPLWADLSGLPPVTVQVGTEEILHSDAVSLVDKIRHEGGQAELTIWPDMPHVHQLAHRFLPEGRAAIHQLAQNLRAHQLDPK